MVHLMGLEVKDATHPDGDIEICFSGLRPGEKLYEELLIGENVRQTAHPRIMAADELSLSWKEMKELLQRLEHHCEQFAVHHIVDLVTEAPTGFSHSSAITDLVDLAARAADEPVLNDKNSTGKAAAGIVVLQPVADIPVGAARAG
jgi:FlaA1/EpsC-like NDP-sugar epimerase